MAGSPPGRFVVVDVETTGFGTSDRVVEVAAILVDWRTGREVEVLHTLLDPERPVGATHVHGITDAMVRGAPRFSKVAPDLRQLLGSAPVVAHNIAFDRRMLTQEFRRIRSTWPPTEEHCTYGLTGQKLAVACAERGIVLDGHHRALADARATAELFRVVTR